ncbi:MAG: cytochrome c biogenesis protein CcsA [Opitutaceae bacterium]|nr:cytochrome c biogenesis protein CcsA [Opitutaceae bacterium]
MKRFLPLLALAVAALGVIASLLPSGNGSAFDLQTYGRLPVLVNGRLKPIDTVARTSLLVLQGRQRVTTPDRRSLSPTEWLLEVLYAPTRADTYATFRIDNPEALDLFSLSPADGNGGVRFSYTQLVKDLSELDRQAKLAEEVEDQLRTPFQREVLRLRHHIVLYQHLENTMQVPDSPDFSAELRQFQKALPAGIAALRARGKGEVHDEAAFKAMMEMARRYDFMDQSGYLLAIAPVDGDSNLNNWKTPGRALLESFDSGVINPTVLDYAALGQAWRSGEPDSFNQIVRRLEQEFVQRYGPQLEKCIIEQRFNSAQPFYTAMVLYVIALLLAVFSWLRWPQVLGRSAFWLLALAFLLTTGGILARMWIEGRPPVTNLYSSALFVGWTAVALCLVLEQTYKNAVGSVAAGLVGFCTLLIAHHLSLGGDTMEMMRAVLDSNFWLATHVVTISIGYGATFLAGFLAVIYIFRGVLTRSLDRGTAEALNRMVYGIVCFATLFSLVGTVLGGIWADQSWGRFWGWDPKENGALIIVIWNALILHARWSGMVRQRGLMALAVFGNVVTAWSWFGVNMLGVGLHSYGFMDAAFYWLVGFVISQLVIICVALLPPEKWRSRVA